MIFMQTRVMTISFFSTHDSTLSPFFLTTRISYPSPIISPHVRPPPPKHPRAEWTCTSATTRAMFHTQLHHNAPRHSLLDPTTISVKK
jgi:hypothetical protein